MKCYAAASMRYGAAVLGWIALVSACSESDTSGQRTDAGSGGTPATGGVPTATGGGPATGGARSSGGLGGTGTGGLATGSGGTGTGGVSAVPDGGPGSDPDSGSPADWLSVVELARGSGRIVEKVAYASGSLRVFGQICRPDDGARHPVILVNHGGFAGLAGESFTGDLEAGSFCLNGAKLGYVIAESSYRGEDGSDGDIEVCLGEVDDVIALLDVVRRQPYADGDRVGAFGGSHGGCITTALAIREPSLRAAVDLCGPSDLYTLTDWWHEQLDQNEPAPFCAPVFGVSPCTAVHEALVGVVEGAIGGPPSAATEAAYRARSPMFRLNELAVPMLFIQGADDYFVNLEQACKKREALTAAGKPPLAWHLDPFLVPRASTSICGGGFRTDAVPDVNNTAAWSGDGPYLFVYESQGHAMTGAANTQAATIALRFLFAHLNQ